MIQAYGALGMPQLRDDAERILRRNFPDSEHAKSMLTQLGR
jgi:outer membrane protein assembly factor BamD (BamD/ComL family)